MTMLRTRWAAVGAAVAVTLGAGGIGLVSATEPAGAAALISMTPCRVIDTRPEFNVGPKTSPLGAGETHTVGVHGDNGDCTGIPVDAVAISMNMTAVDATAPTFLTVWEADAPQPVASSLNPTPGSPPTPNAVTTDLNPGGEFSIFNLAGNVHVLADINGYYVDHTHDDRYYTKAQVRDVVAADVQVTDGIFLDQMTMVPEATFLTAETVTTDRDGHLLISKYLLGSLNCLPASSAARVYFITVDGVGIRSSAIYSSSNELHNVRLQGVTEGPIDRGEHEIAVGGECHLDSRASVNGITYVSNASVIVLPAD